MPGKKATTKKKKSSKTPDFETAMAELEALVETMEQGDLSLEDSLTSFERGIALTRDCQHALKTAEQKVKILIEKNGQSELADFNDE